MALFGPVPLSETGNVLPMLAVARDNWRLSQYLIGQVLQTTGHQFESEAILPSGAAARMGGAVAASACRSSNPIRSHRPARIRHRAGRQRRQVVCRPTGRSPGASTPIHHGGWRSASRTNWRRAVAGPAEGHHTDLGIDLKQDAAATRKSTPKRRRASPR